MKTINASQAESNLYLLIEETNDSHLPIQITGKSSNAVLVSADDWLSIQETLFLISIPDMRESIIEGLKTPPDECAGDLDW